MNLDEFRLPKDPCREILELLNDYAAGLRNRKQNKTALVALRRAIAIDPTVPQLWANLGCVLMNEQKFEDALEPMIKATELGPETAYHWGNLALLYCALRRYDDAENAFEECLNRATKDEEKSGRSGIVPFLRLELGDWKRGFQEYECRIERMGAKFFQPFPEGCKKWTGEPLDGKRLYVQAEQGIGDRLLFSRYIWELHQRWPTCELLVCMNEKFTDLFWEFRHFVTLLPHGIPWPENLDYGVYLGSLPGFKPNNRQCAARTGLYPEAC
jgi:tetratricopeptide (TPR) repeat protein